MTSSKLILGATKLFCIMRIEYTASLAPAIQFSWPVMDFVEETKGLLFDIEDWRLEIGFSSTKRDYDKLILEIWTDGSVTPREGVSIGAKIMQEHLNLFVGLDDSAEGMEISSIPFDENP